MAIVDGDAGAMGSHIGGDGAPNTTGSAGNQRDFLGKQWFAHGFLFPSTVSGW
jgi:hypothetical protein